MKKTLRILIALVLLILSFTFSIIRTKAEEVQDDVPTNVEVLDEENTEVLEEKSEIEIWFEEKVMPHIFTFASSLTGTGLVIILLKKLVKRVLTEAKNRLEAEIEAKYQAEKDIKDKQIEIERFLTNLEDKLNIIIENKLNLYQEKVDNALKEIEIEHEEYISTKEKAEELAKYVSDIFEIKLESEENEVVEEK